MVPRTASFNPELRLPASFVRVSVSSTGARTESAVTIRFALRGDSIVARIGRRRATGLSSSAKRHTLGSYFEGWSLLIAMVGS